MNYSEKLNNLIPGGAHTYSRGDDQYPSNAPKILAKGKGCYVWDTEGNKYLDYGMALRANTIGYSYEPIDNAAIKEIQNGNNLTRASMIELKAAEVITALIPSADMVKFAKNGSTATSAAVKLARAYTGRKMIARCVDHPFFSYDDWFIGDTPLIKGIPQEIYKLTLNFHYNDLPSLKKLFDEYPNEIACIILQPAVNEKPKDGFLHKAKELCHQNGTLFILDEMITGFRWHLNGAESYYDIKPDLSTFGKGMANGFSVAALTGKREIMNLGGIKEVGKERVFLVSTTHGAEMSGLGAFVKTVDCYKELKVVEHLWDYGRKMIDGMNNIAKDFGLENYFIAKGYPCSPEYCTLDQSGNNSLDFRTLFSQEMIKNGVLIPWIALSYAHNELELELTFEATRKSLQIYEQALDKGLKRYLVGDSIKPVFRKYN